MSASAERRVSASGSRSLIILEETFPVELSEIVNEGCRQQYLDAELSVTNLKHVFMSLDERIPDSHETNPLKKFTTTGLKKLPVSCHGHYLQCHPSFFFLQYTTLSFMCMCASCYFVMNHDIEMH